MEDYEFERTKQVLKARVKAIKEDIQMSEEEKKQHLASINRQWTALKKEFTKDLPQKEHYKRANKKQEDTRYAQEYVDR